MGERTDIRWCDDTHNFWQGCTKVSDGCKNRYAEARDKRFTGGKLWGEGAARQRSKDFCAPMRWNKKPFVCDVCGRENQFNDGCCDFKFGDGTTCQAVSYHRRRVFSLSLGDWLDDEAPIEWLSDMLKVIHDCPNLDFLLLTKRPENWLTRLKQVFMWHSQKNIPIERDFYGFIFNWMGGVEPQNVWLGVSVENQKCADERREVFKSIPAKIKFVSYEPALEIVDWTHWDFINWIIVGGESGRNARPFNIQWAVEAVQYCREIEISCFVKQLGSNPFEEVNVENKLQACFKNLRHKKGGDISEFPKPLQIREFPIL